MQSRTVVANGIPMRWMEQGEGFPVVLVHGIPTSPALWRLVVPLLSGARCLAWEMVGYGASIAQGRDRDISVNAQADYLASFLDALDIRRAVLAGHDLGGGVVQILAVRRPDLCVGLFLTNAIGYDSWPIPSVKAMRMASGLIRHLPSAALKPVMATLFARGHDDASRAKEALRVHWPHYATAEGPPGFVRQIRSLHVDDTLAVADDLKRLRVPAGLVWGAADQFQKIGYGERFASDLSAPLHRIPSGKHFTPEDHPDAVATGIGQVLAAAVGRT